MGRQQFTHKRERVLKKILLTSNTLWMMFSLMLLTIARLSQAFKKGFFTFTTLWMVFSLILLTSVNLSQAEIYRWKDDKGVVRYSNAPPKSEGGELLNVIPTHRVPLVEDANGTVYYLNLPDSELTQDMSSQDVLDQLSLPSDVLDELVEDASSKAKEMQAEPLSTVTFRLAELEEALEREITKRLKWEQEYLKSQSRSTQLEQRNELLHVALADMGSKVDKVQKAVALSEIHVSALREPQQQMGQLESRIGQLQAVLAEQNSEQELVRLEGKIVQLQASLTETSKQSEEEVAEVSSTLDNVQETQGLQLASLNGRLDELEIGVGSFQQQAFSEKFTTLSQEIQGLKSSLPEGYDDSQLQARLQELQNTQKQQVKALETRLIELDAMKTTYEEHIQVLSDKLETLEASMDEIDRSTMMAKVDALVERVAAFEQQPQDEAIHVKLAALETAMATLTDAMPVSRNTSTLVAKLLADREHLEAMSGRQSGQIQQQQAQIALLRDEIEQLKVRDSERPEVTQATLAAEPPSMAILAENTVQMQDIVQLQAGVLALQQERIVAIENRLEQDMVKGDSLQSKLSWIGELEGGGQKVKTNPNSRITVVERQYRRGATRASALGVYVNK